MVGQVIATHVGGSGRNTRYRYQVECDGIVAPEVFEGRHSLIATMGVWDTLVFQADDYNGRAAVRGAAYAVARSRGWRVSCTRAGEHYLRVQRLA